MLIFTFYIYKMLFKIDYFKQLDKSIFKFFQSWLIFDFVITNIQSATSYKHAVQNSSSTFRALSVIARNNALMSSQNSFNNFF